ncbi:MAG: NACHT domain-containing protein [Chloroflexi bacterium]|nr:NACHT domain-containing protein [Chloroflexota bacterium]
MSSETDQHNRHVMLQRVKHYWLVGVLQESLHGAEIIDISMATRPSAVVNQQAGAYTGFAYESDFDQPIPLGTPIIDVYESAQGSMLIMGEPGGGKTTTLLQLVSSLLERAEFDELRPIPVVFGLATWQEGQTLAEWIVNSLSNQYEVPRKLGQRWLADGKLLPLLDGLDEVDASRREACAAAINLFQEKRPSLPTIVTCRSQDYKNLPVDLKLAQAIVLQPLSMAQIDTYLASVGKRLAGVRAALQTDDTLRDLAQSPLMLSIMTLAYYRMPEDVAISLGERNVGRQLLFEVYVERMTRYRDGGKLYQPDMSVRWLSWLSRSMSRQNQTLFFLEGMQPTWLLREQQRPFSDKLRFAMGGLIAAIGVMGGLIGWVLSGWQLFVFGTVFGLMTGSITSIASISPIRSRIHWRKIETVETVNWSWPWAWLSLPLGIVIGLLVGWPLSLLTQSDTQLSVPWLLLMPILFAGLLISENALIPNELKMRTTPGQGVILSRQNGVRIGGLAGVVTAVTIIIGLGIATILQIPFDWRAILPLGLITAVYIGTVTGLRLGGLAAIQHKRLLKQLEKEGSTPLEYINFLDYASERSLLRKVGGGYMFVHALLLDYFGSIGD